MHLKFFLALLLLCTIQYIRAEADAEAEAEAEADAGASASADAKAEAKPSHGCPTSMKACSNGQCLPLKWFCDGDKDCPWGEDELNCGGHVPWKPQSAPKPQVAWVSQTHWTQPRPEPQPQPEPQHWQPQPEPQPWQLQPEPQPWQLQPESQPWQPQPEPQPWQPQPEPQPWQPQPEPQPWQPQPEPQHWQPEPVPEPQLWQSQPQKWQLPTSSPQLPNPHWDGSVYCAPGYFRCGRSCLPQILRCNGIVDCSDSSDEKNCVIIPTERPTTVPTCGDDEVQCYAGNCIKESKLCDGYVDCRHYEDEFACSFVKNKAYTYRCIEQCIGIQRPNCSSTTSIPHTPPPTTTTVRPTIRFCDPGFTLIYNRCIQVTVFPPLDWKSARDASRAFNSRLVEIDNGDFFLQLQAFLNQSRYESYSYWTGATDIAVEGDWAWNDSLKKVHLGAPLWSIAREGLTYEQQPAGGRQQNCGLLEDCPFQYMNDENCEKKYPYICQRTARFKYV